ncbi:MAG: hypothetical protein Q7T82_19360 [Armatimonadota bacterium]|nr:hypothetical protein [Armatimonadota bacterium]
MRRGDSNNTRKRPLFYVGPGLILALVAAIVIGKTAMRSERDGRQTAPPIIERRTVSSADDRLGPIPEVEFLLDHRARLELSGEQIGKLARLQADWEKVYGPKLKEAVAAGRKLGGYLSKAENDRRTPVAQIQRESAPLVSASGEIAKARREFWSRALRLLTAEQRKVADGLREAEMQRKSKELADKVKQRF